MKRDWWDSPDVVARALVGIPTPKTPEPMDESRPLNLPSEDEE